MTLFLRVLGVLLVAAACGAQAGPTAYSTAHPAPNAAGWNTTNVDVFLQVSLAAKGLPAVSYFMSGAQVTKQATVQGFTTTVPVRAEGETRVTFFGTDDTGDGGWHFHDVRIDRTPPKSQVNLTSLTPGGDYEAAIKGDDPPGGSANASSGVREIRYNIDGFGPDQVVAGDSTTVKLQKGWTRLIFWAVDEAGNEEYPYQVITRNQGAQLVPDRVEITAPVGGAAFGSLRIVQTNPFFPTDVLDMSTDSPFFKPTGGCIFPMAGVVACHFQVAFFPPAVGDFAATLFVKTNNPLQPVITAELHGRGALPGLAFAPDPVAFPVTQVGGWSASVTVTVTNDGTVPLVLTGLTTTSNAFPIMDDRCGATTLAPFASCEVDIAFHPYGYGLHPGALEVYSNLPGPPRTVPFEAFGSLPTQLGAYPASIDFGVVSIGDYAKATVEIGNSGPVPYFVQDFSFAGPGAAMYLVTDAQCTNGVAPTSVEPKQVCRVDMLYRPTLAGVHDATLKVRSSMGQPDFDVPVTGSAP